MRVFPPHSRLGTYLACAHMAVVLLYVAQIVYAHVPEWPIAWWYMAVFDFPVSVPLWFIVQRLPDNPNDLLSDWSGFLGPALYYGTVGTVWWYFLGCLFSRWRAKVTSAARI